MANLDLLGWVEGFGGGFTSILKTVLIALPILLLFAFILLKIKERSIYVYKVRIYRVRENGGVKELNGRGGYIGRRGTAPFFRIKIRRFLRPAKKIDLTTTPSPAYIDEEDRVYFKQIDVDTYVQLGRTFPTDKNSFQFHPVESDVKYGALLDIHKIKEVLRAEPTWKKILPYASLLILGVIFIVAYALLIGRCG